MRRLIVGCGYLGTRVLAQWRDLGGPIFAVTRRTDRAEQLREQGAEPVVADVLVPASLRNLPDVDTVLYAVGRDRGTGHGMREVYVGGLGNVLDALPRPRCFLYVSSTSVYGQANGEDVDETAITAPVEESGRIVLEAETVLRQRMPHAIILRFAGIYGPGRLLRQQAIVKGEPIAVDPDKWLNLIHVEDGAGAVCAAEVRGEPGQTYNVCDDRPISRREYYSLLAQLLNAPPRFVPPTAPDAANRRIVNSRMHAELGCTLRYPSYREGLAAAVGTSEDIA